MSEFRKIPCVVYIWPNPIAVGFTSTYRAAKRIQREVRRFHADSGITEAWNWPALRSANVTTTPPTDAAEAAGDEDR